MADGFTANTAHARLRLLIAAPLAHTEMRSVDPPAGLRQEYEAWSWSVAWSYEGAVTTWRLKSPEGRTRFVKVRASEESPRLLDEAARLEWAGGHLPVAEVVKVSSDGDVDWLVLEGLPGQDATSPDLIADRERLVPTLAEGLRRFHEAPVELCPFRLTVEDALATVRRRVDEGRAEHGDLHPEFSHLSSTRR